MKMMITQLIVYSLLLFLWIHNTQAAKSFPDTFTEAYCAFTKSFTPVPPLFLPIVHFCNQTNVPLLRCNDSLCGLSGDVRGDLKNLIFNLLDSKGTIPTELGYLNTLNGIDLSLNDDLIGTIPTQIGNLTNLSYITFEYNPLLSGTIPTQIGNLKSLVFLNIFYNALLSGTIPTQIGNIKSLEFLHLTSNAKFSGTIPTQIGHLINLTILTITASNQLSGTIPTQIGNLSNLTYLEMLSLGLSGTIPTQIGNCRNLSSIFLLGMQISGTIPTQIGNLQNTLSTISLFGMQISGTIPTQIGKLSLLKSLSLNNNSLTGTIPNTFEFLQLNILVLSNNYISGIIPDLQKLSVNLTILDITNNNFSGPLPQSSYPPLLQTLFVSSNKINGPIPSTLGLLPLKSIDLSSTQICVESFPSQWLNKSWEVCNLKVSFSCGIDVPKECLVNNCIGTLKCFEDQCVNGTHKCQNQRKCVPRENGGYYCTDCGSIYQNDGDFKCAPLPNMIILITSLGLIIIFLALLISHQINKKRIPHSSGNDNGNFLKPKKKSSYEIIPGDSIYKL